MKALILSGGKGIRLRPLTHTLPKQLVPVANNPIINFVVRNIVDAGIKDIGVIVSPQSKEQIESVLKSYWAQEARFTFIIQEEPLGLAHAVKLAKDFIGKDSFVMYLGDNLIGRGIKEFIDTYKRDQNQAFVLLKEVPDPSMFGVAVIEEGKIKDLIEKPKEVVSNYALVGIYIFSPDIFEAVQNIKPSWRNELEITDAIKYLLKNGKGVGYHVLKEWWIDTGKKDDLLTANKLVLNDLIETRINGVCKSSRIEGVLSLGDNSIIENCKIKGPVCIDEGCVIKNSDIGPYASVGRGSKVEDSKIENSLILENCHISRLKLIKESLIGKNVEIINTNDKWTHETPYVFMLSDDSKVKI